MINTDRPETKNQFKIYSTAFADGARIPTKYTCDAESPVSPPLSIRNLPEGTKSMALIMDDPDIPESVKQARGIEVFDHWVVYNITRDIIEIAEGVAPGTEGNNSTGATGYRGPCPPDREHRYFFKVYALDTTLNFIKAPTRKELEDAISPHVLASAKYMGRYEREKKSE
jgi:Raf kinase inhibitor-like YbhB/YbcL family protein